jgi:D-3-phosphoglycerate dehydrogenase / 2-oxoglutarate reductase
MAKYKVVVSDNRHGDYSIEAAVLKPVDAEVVIEDCSTVEEMIIVCRDADGVLLDQAPMPAKVIENMAKCKVVSRYGVGYDNVDVEACTRKKIYVANVPDYCMEDVSDHAMALFYSCVRRITLRDKQVRQGGWNMDRSGIFRIKGRVFALVGFGNIARCLAGKLYGLGLKKVLVYDPYVSKEIIEALGAQKADLETVLSEADYISLHMPVTAETKGIIDKKAFSLMKDSAILINTARGPLIDEEALIDALSNGKIAFAGLDTHNKEPLPAGSPLLKMDNCILTDHVGFYSVESMEELHTKTAENIKAVLEGGKPIYQVNKL